MTGGVPGDSTDGASQGTDAIDAPVSEDSVATDPNRTEVGPVAVDLSISLQDSALESADYVDSAVVDAAPDPRIRSCGEIMDWSQSILDDGVTGTGTCANATVGSLINTIRTEHPELADIERVCSPYPGCWVTFYYTDIKVLPYGEGFRIVLRKATGQPATHSPEDDWYFQTDATCYPDLIGHLHILWSFGHCNGIALWGCPAYFCSSEEEGNIAGCPGGLDASSGS
jgi:hypothetical protein